MKTMSKRLADLEVKVTAPARYLVYQEQLEGEHSGLFARKLDDGTTRYVARDDVAADADGATAILIEYYSDLGPVDVPTVDNIQLPSNGREQAL